MNTVLVGMFESQSAAEKARSQLMAAGFDSGSVSMTGGTSSSASTSSSSSSGYGQRQESGGIAGFFESLFGGNDRDDTGYADTYKEAFNRGSYGVTVTAQSESEVDRAEQVLNACGAVDIDEQAQGWRSEGWQGGQQPQAASLTGAAGTQLNDGTSRTLQEVEEELKVGKRAVARGGVRIFTRMTEVPVQESVTLREEHANVQRRTVDRPATEADFAAFKEGSIEVRESAEEAVVSKSARVVGEVEIGKTVTEREEIVRDTVRKTQVDVEQIEGGREQLGTTSLRQPAMAGSETLGSGNDRVFASGSTDRDLLGSGSPNRDPLSGELGAHPVGTGVGAVAGGVATGAAVGTVAGPIGTAVGAAVGAVAGGLAGKGVAEEVDPTIDDTRRNKPL